MTSKPTITLQSLALLEEKATQDLWRSDCILPPEHATRLHTIRTADDPPTRIIADKLYERDGVFIVALVNYYRSGELQRLAELAEAGAEDKARLDYLEQEMALEQQYFRDGSREDRPLALFRRNIPITRTFIDAARAKDRHAMTCERNEMKRDSYDSLAQSLVQSSHLKRVLDKANEDHEAFALWLADALREKHVYALPAGIVEALNFAPLPEPQAQEGS